MAITSASVATNRKAALITGGVILGMFTFIALAVFAPLVLVGFTFLLWVYGVFVFVRLKLEKNKG